MQVPFALAFQLNDCNSPIGVLTANKANLTQQHFTTVRSTNNPVRVQGMGNITEFRDVILKGKRTTMDVKKVELEIMQAASELVEHHLDISSIVLECTDIPPFAYTLQQRFALPTFDIITLVNMAHDVVLRQPFQGFMPIETKPDTSS